MNITVFCFVGILGNLINQTYLMGIFAKFIKHIVAPIKRIAPNNAAAALPPLV